MVLRRRPAFESLLVLVHCPCRSSLCKSLIAGVDLVVIHICNIATILPAEELHIN